MFMKAKDHADFLRVNKAVLSCSVKEMHTGRTAAACIEGEKVFPCNHEASVSRNYAHDRVADGESAAEKVFRWETRAEMI